MVADFDFSPSTKENPHPNTDQTTFLASSLCEARQHTDSWAHKPRPFFSWPRALKSDHKPPGFESPLARRRQIINRRQGRH